LKYVPRQPREGINVSSTHPLRELVVLTAGIAAAAFALFLLVSLLVSLAAPLVSPEVERRVFESWSLALMTTTAADEPSDELHALFGRLAAHWSDNPYDLRLGILPTAEINALAVPGGGVLVTRGLLDAVDSDAALAFVLGHELGHFAHRDHLRRLGRSMSFALVLASIGIGGGAGSASGIVGYMNRMAGTSFDRRQELAADHFGLELVQAKFGHVAGGIDFFERLRAEERHGQASWLTYLSTHPAHETRIDAIYLVADQRGWPVAAPEPEAPTR
jgi:predicted Zn-dependent protease